MKIATDISARREQFKPTKVEADLSGLSEGHTLALSHLSTAARAINALFDRQAWAHNPEFAEKVGALEGPLAENARAYYRIMRGPWDRLKRHEPFLGETQRPQGAGFYPEDMGRDEFTRWLENHPQGRESLTSPAPPSGATVRALKPCPTRRLTGTC